MLSTRARAKNMFFGIVYFPRRLGERAETNPPNPHNPQVNHGVMSRTP
jgi:hypothetical protein